MRLNKYLYFLLVSSIISLTYFVYKPGIFGGFIFDDLVNLQNIQFFAKSDGLSAFIRYIFSFESGPLKRPISTLSFLINSTHWPASPIFFKLTNIIIHLINGVLLYFVTKKLLKYLLVKREDIRLVAFFNMSIWILHPFFVSTTLYVVQRMAMLPTTFTLIGFYFYIFGRESLKTHNIKGWVCLFFAVYFCTGFAVLSKENGIVLPFLLFVFEVIVLKNSKIVSMTTKHKMILFFVPLVAITLAFIYKTPDFISDYSYREYSMSERLLTESRVLCIYLYHLFYPDYLTGGVYVDGFVISKSIFEPLTTIFAVLFLIFATFFIVLNRIKYQLFSFALAFFFVAHFIESSIIPLEIYFEHRNYLPSLFLFLPITVFIVERFRKYNFNYLLLSLIVAYLAYITHLRSELWSDNMKMTDSLLNKHPQSVRLVDQSALNQLAQGNTNNAINIITTALPHHKDILLRLNLLNLKCSINSVTLNDFDDAIKYIEKIKITSEDIPSIAGILRVLIKGECEQNNLELALKLIDTFKFNDGYKNNAVKAVVDFNYAMIIFKQNNFESALNLFKSNFINYLNFDDLIFVIKLFIDEKQYESSWKLINLFESVYNDTNVMLSNVDYNIELNSIKLNLLKIQNETINNHSSKK